ncbi:hypothetical protein M9Y10_002804 [Tritrichomonas musculus]|uniref:Eukaryotic translation initiation factor 2A n=1 Tax=Tritrichomonas musculus TaxID=1915356 RepID=A0ABR2LB84_9EUKA
MSVLKASQDAKRAIKYNRRDNKGNFTVFDIENSDDIKQIFSTEDNPQITINSEIIDCSFLPSEFGFVIAFGYEDGTVKFIKENPDKSYTPISSKIGGSENDNGPSFELQAPKFVKNLRISYFPPELNIGYISEDMICIFFVDFQISSITLIPIRRYSAPNTIWFNFTNKYSIWRCTTRYSERKGKQELTFENYNLNSFVPANTISDLPSFLDIASEKDFIDASISPVQFKGEDKIAVLKSDGENNILACIIFNSKNIIQIKTEAGIKDPVSIEWSPFGTRIAVFSADQTPTIFIESSATSDTNSWKPMQVKL